MTSCDLDPLFVKGLKLLHSKNKDSTDQLKQLLDEVIAQTKQMAYSKEKIYTSVKLEGESKIHIKKAPREATEPISFSSKYSSDDSRERKAEKRQSDKVKQDSIESEAKIPKLEPPQGYAYYPSSPPDLPKLDQYIPKKDEDSDSSEENADADDFAMEMGLACVICKFLDVTQGNNLVECQECHSLYHQECHKPPITDDINDPRRVWYCAKCVKNMKKITTKTQKSTKTGVSVSSKEIASQPKSTRSDGSPPAVILPFKRSEVKSTLSQGSNPSANKPIGLAGLAANFGGRSATTASSAVLSSATRAAKTATSGTSLKTAFTSASSTKSSLASSSGLMSKMTPASGSFPSSSTSSGTTSGSQKSTSAPATKGLGLLSAAVASSTTRSSAAAASGNGNSGPKVPSYSPLMSADKRLQIMKKRASKMQERRRMSNK